MVQAFINITGKTKHIRTRVNSAPVSYYQWQRMMVESPPPRFRVVLIGYRVATNLPAANTHMSANLVKSGA